MIHSKHNNVVTLLILNFFATPGWGFRNFDNSMALTLLWAWIWPTVFGQSDIIWSLGFSVTGSNKINFPKNNRNKTVISQTLKVANMACQLYFLPCCVQTKNRTIFIECLIFCSKAQWHDILIMMLPLVTKSRCCNMLQRAGMLQLVGLTKIQWSNSKV
jgi:hypothetical protein